MRSLFTEEQTARIINEYLKGRSQKDIATQYGVTQSCISDLLKRNKVQARDPRKIKIPKEEYPKIIELYTTRQVNEYQIADQYGVSQTTINRILRKAGVERYKKISQTQVPTIIDEYLKGKSQQQIAEIYGVEPTNIGYILRVNGVKCKKAGPYRTYKLDEHSFDDIDSERKAYVLGLLYADGNNSNGKSVKISLVEYDKELLEEVKTIFGTDKPLIINDRSRENRRNMCILDINSRHVSEMFEKYGVVPNKTFKLMFPEFLREDLIRHFIRGYFDGDGCIGIYTNRKYGYKNASFNIACRASFAYRLKALFYNMGIHGTVSSYKSSKHDPENGKISVSGNLQIKRLMDWMYDGTTIRLERKYRKYIELCEIVKNSPKKHYNKNITYKLVQSKLF